MESIVCVVHIVYYILEFFIVKRQRRAREASLTVYNYSIVLCVCILKRSDWHFCIYPHATQSSWIGQQTTFRIFLKSFQAASAFKVKNNVIIKSWCKIERVNRNLWPNERRSRKDARRLFSVSNLVQRTRSRKSKQQCKVHHWTQVSCAFVVFLISAILSETFVVQGSKIHLRSIL